MRFKVGDRVEVLPIKEDFEDLLRLTHGLDVVGMIGNITNIRECVSYPITVTFITVDNGRVKGNFKEGELELVEQGKYGMRAKFIGKDRSMGFRNGKIYQIITDVNINSKGKAFLWLYDKDSRLNCPYKNLEALLANWKIMDN